MIEEDDIEMAFDPEEGYPPDEDEVLGEDEDEPTRRYRTGNEIAARNRVPRGDSPRMLAMERQRRALELRKSGATFEQIAKTLGYADHTSASKAVKRAMERSIQEPAAELRTLNIERINHMLLTIWSKVQAGDELAIDRALRLIDKLDRYMGTETLPTQKIQLDGNIDVRSAVLVIDGDKDEFITGIKRMLDVNEDEERQREQEARRLLESNAIPELTSRTQPIDTVAVEVEDDKIVKKRAPRMKSKPSAGKG